jgi:hypothetical protein
MIVTTCDWDWNKRVNNPNGVFSGVTYIIGGQNWSDTPNIVQYFIGKLEHINMI